MLMLRDHLMQIDRFVEGEEVFNFLAACAQGTGDLYLADGNARHLNLLETLCWLFELHRLVTAVEAQTHIMSQALGQIQARKKRQSFFSGFKYTQRLGLQR